MADDSRALVVRAATDTATLEFHGDGITVMHAEDGTWLVLNQLTANLGLDAQAQQRAIERSAWSKGRTAVTAVLVPGDVRPYPRFLIHVRILPMWLANITTGRIRDEEVRRKVEIYQLELADVLYEYATTGQVERAELAPALPRTYAEALRELAATVEAKELAEAELESVRPKADAFDTYLVAEQDPTILRTVAKALGLKERALRHTLIHAGFIFWSRTNTPCGVAQYEPYAQYGPTGTRLFEVKRTTVTHETWGECVHQTLTVTAKGVERIRQLLASQAASIEAGETR